MEELLGYISKSLSRQDREIFNIRRLLSKQNTINFIFVIALVAGACKIKRLRCELDELKSSTEGRES